MFLIRQSSRSGFNKHTTKILWVLSQNGRFQGKRKGNPLIQGTTILRTVSYKVLAAIRRETS